MGFCQITLRNWEASGKIRGHRHPINKHWLYDLADFHKLLKATERSAVRYKRKPR